MATKAKKITKKATKISVAKKVNTSLVNASIASINTTVENSEKWQKLASKLVKKSEKVRKQQINMIFDTAEAVKGQFIVGTDKMKDLVGIEGNIIEKAKDFARQHPVSKKVLEIVEDITEKVSSNPMVKKAEKATEDLKKKGYSKFKELKSDVLDQASKILDKGEAMIEDAKSNPKAKTGKKVTPKKTGAKKATKVKATKVVAKAAPKKVVVKKVTKTKAKATKVVAKAAPKKVAAKKAIPTKVKVTKVVAKVSPKANAKVAKTSPVVKKETVSKMNIVEVKKTIETTVKDDLKLIYGIGPKIEISLNNNGIKTYADLAKFESAEVEAILEKAGTTFANTDAKDWKKQAEVGVKEGSEGLIKWVEKYRTA